METNMAIKIKNLLIISVSALLLSTSASSAEEHKQEVLSNETLLKQISKGFSNVAKHATPAVVYIESQGVPDKSEQPITRKGAHENPFEYFNDDFFNRFFGFPFEQKKPKSTETVRGSGFLVTKDGYIVTNNHVVEKANKVTVTLTNGKKFVATIVGTDPKTDLAVIKIDGNDYPF